jgi:glycogen debranching enzyme
MKVKTFPRSVLVGREALAARAQEVLRQNDMGGWTRAAPELYPHQWSWDTGFIAIGLAHLDIRRAARELLTLFEHQWKTGKVPHSVFNPAPSRPRCSAPGSRRAPAFTTCDTLAPRSC